MIPNTYSSLILGLGGFLTVFSTFSTWTIHIYQERHDRELRRIGPPPRLYGIKVFMLSFLLSGAVYLAGSLLSWSFDIYHWRWRSMLILILWILAMADSIYMDLRRFGIISVMLLIAGMSFSIASLCSWSFNLFHWHWYSILIGGIGCLWFPFDFTFHVINRFFLIQYFTDPRVRDFLLQKDDRKNKNEQANDENSPTEGGDTDIITPSGNVFKF